MRFHIPAIPHTVSTPAYSSCAFTQKVVKLCRMLVAQGHEVFHYGSSMSRVEGTNVVVTRKADLDKSYPGHRWERDGFPNFSKTDHIYSRFYANTIEEIRARKQPGDFLLCSFGDFHKPLADAHPDLITVESGIGYPNGTFAPYKVYESYAIMHAYQTNAAAMAASNSFWYDAVIPNAFDPDEFEFQSKKQDFFLFLGRLNSGKGIHIAKQIAEATRTRLVIAGPGQQEADTDLITYYGNVGPKKRASLLAHAKATICASTFLEPFCGVQIESMISGTPVISSDRGAFAEYNIQGKTGYRCRTFEQFVWAANNVHRLSSGDCRAQGMKFTLAKTGPKYVDYFRSLLDIKTGKGWYEPRTDRETLF